MPDERAGRDAVGGDDVGAVDPDVAGFEAGGAAGGDLDFGEIRRCGSRGHEDMVMPAILQREF